MWLFFTIHCSGVVDCKSVGVFFAYLLAYPVLHKVKALAFVQLGVGWWYARYVLPFLRSCKSAIAQNIFGSCSAHAGILPCSICSNFSSLLFFGAYWSSRKIYFEWGKALPFVPTFIEIYLVPFLLTWGYHRKRKNSTLSDLVFVKVIDN